MKTTVSAPMPPASLALRSGLWTAQLLLALLYLPSAYMKLLMPVTEVAKQIPWAADVSLAFLHFIGVVDLAAGIGLVLPSLTRIQPRLTVWAAIGSSVLQVLAIGFHWSRGDYAKFPAAIALNVIALLLSVFVAWGRGTRARVMPRGGAA